MSVAMKYFNNEEDAALCVNDSYIKICNKIGTYNSEYSFITWSRTILVRTILDDLRKNKKFKAIIAFSDKIEEFNIYDEETNEELMEENGSKILDAMEKLPPATKKVVKLYLLEGYSHKEVSEILEISAETSKWHLKTGKSKLRELLTD